MLSCFSSVVSVFDVGCVHIKPKGDEVVEKDTVAQRQHVKVKKLSRGPDDPLHLVDSAPFGPGLTHELWTAGLLQKTHSSEVDS